jgi:hypothetical protein
VFAANVLVQLDTETWFVGDFEVTIFVEGAVPLNNVLPVRDLHTV